MAVFVLAFDGVGSGEDGDSAMTRVMNDAIRRELSPVRLAPNTFAFFINSEDESAAQSIEDAVRHIVHQTSYVIFRAVEPMICRHGVDTCQALRASLG